MKLAFMGERGAFGDEAARRFGADVPLACASFADVVRAVREGRVDGGVLPIENSHAGVVKDALGPLLDAELFVSGALDLRVRHQLFAWTGVALSSVRRARSHPQALAQCATFLERHGIEPISAPSTAAAARIIAELRPTDEAAISSELAGSLHGLSRLAANIEASPNNATRFLYVTRDAREAGDATQALVQAFDVGLTRTALEHEGLRITRVHALPPRGLIEVETSLPDAALERALQTLGGKTRLAGVYRQSGSI